MSSKDVRITLRWESELIERVDALATKIGEKVPGLNLSRAQTIRVAVERMLEAEGLGAKKTAPKRSGRAKP